MRRGSIVRDGARGLVLAACLLAAGAGGGGAGAAAAATPSAHLPVVDPTVPANREVEPVVLTGADLRGWAVPSNTTAKAPLTDLADCPPGSNTDNCQHNRYVAPEVDTSSGQNQLPAKGVPTDRLLGYRWTGRRFVQVPFQVDKVFTRYLENDASGFAIYSGADQHTTYQWDREGFRAYPDPRDPCHALYRPAAKDPIPFFDTNDEVSFMYSDSGPRAPRHARLPKGIRTTRLVQITDPLNRSAGPRYVYVMVAGAHGPKSAYNASNGYVRYLRDSNADEFVFSQSAYSNYGNAP